MKRQSVRPSLLNIAKKIGEKSQLKKAIGNFDDSAVTHSRYSIYLQNAPEAIQGHGGDDTTYQVACEGRDYGLSPQAVFELMSEHYNPRCSPPWPDKQLKAKVNNAFRYGKNPQGCKNPQADFADIFEEDVSAAGISTITASALMDMEFSEPRWAIPPILPEGLTVLAGPPKVGKSWMAYSIACSVSTGAKALGMYRASEGEVLYMALEDSLRRLKSRLVKLSSADGRLISERLNLSCDLPRFDDGGLDALDAWLREHPQCRMVIIDTLSRFSPDPNKTMNAYDNDYRALAAMQKLAISHQIALVMITHLRKQQSNDPMEQVMGSTGITGAADAIWILKRSRGESNGILHITGRDLEEQELAVQFEKATCQWMALGDAAKYEVGQERLKIIEYLEQADEPAGPKEVAEALGKKEGNVKNLMRKMHKAGQIGRESRGRYYAKDPGDDFSDFLSESPSGLDLLESHDTDDLDDL